MARKKSAARSTPVEAIRHKDTRKNIPTEELRDFVVEEPQPPVRLYPRDPSLDPQLVWQGKDEQDRQDLAVPVLPIYIQEKVHPQALIDDLRSRFAEKPDETQLDLFADFNGIDSFEKKVEFYQHDAHWTNRLILGDSLMVMTSLAEKEGLKGQVQMIYLDPPYGIKFGSNWQVSTRKRDVKDGNAADATRQPEQVKAFRDTWELGIHSYLAYLRDRLVAARDLLSESGSVFVQIGDENVHLARSLLDEVFGSDNFCSLITVSKTGSLTGELLSSVADFILWYSKEKAHVRYRKLFAPRTDRSQGEFSADPLKSDGYRSGTTYDYGFHRRTFACKSNEHWKVTKEGMDRLDMADRLIPLTSSLRLKKHWEDFPAIEYTNIWQGMGGASGLVYVVQTNTRIIECCLLMTTDPGDLVLDPTCGSETTAYVAEQWGRRWITTDTSRVALTLARTRLMAGRFPYYLLADSPAGVAKEADVTGQTPPAYRTEEDIRKGFVYKRVPHVTLKAIANNEEIDAIHARWQEKLEPVRAALNKAFKQTWDEWEIPREPDETWPAAARKLHGQWWELRRGRQKEIDASIARRADQELLYDQPYEDAKRVRVTGPFTVESLSPHRRLTVQDKRERAAGRDGMTIRTIGPDPFGLTIIENLRKAGIQARDRKERLKFDTLEPFAGEWIHAAGTFTDAGGEAKRVAVCIGPEHGTVGPELVKEAAKEAVRGIGFDLLYLCGFAFDPHVDEETQRYGKLHVQICRMNPDLSMGDELLKKTGAGNLFMVFGEPDIDITRTGDKQVQVEIRGVDVYDPTTGQIRSHSTDDIACWFIDTDYDGESFFVRHAYFTGADQPYEKLKRALRAEIDEAAWSALYSTRSLPFPAPTQGKIAVKVINHYGDEVLKVYEVR